MANIVFADSESGQHYRASISKIRARGFYVSRGQGPQAALPLSEWESGETRADALPETAAEQMALWR